jgi:hypothetical protein
MAPANPTGNPNFNLKNWPEVKKSGPELPEIAKKIAATLATFCRKQHFVTQHFVTLRKATFCRATFCRPTFSRGTALYPGNSFHTQL